MKYVKTSWTLPYFEVCHILLYIQNILTFVVSYCSKTSWTCSTNKHSTVRFRQEIKLTRYMLTIFVSSFER